MAAPAPDPTVADIVAALLVVMGGGGALATTEDVPGDDLEAVPYNTIAVVGESATNAQKFVTTDLTVSLTCVIMVPGGIPQARAVRDGIARRIMADRSLGGLADETAIESSDIQSLTMSDRVGVCSFVVSCSFIGRGF